MAAMLPRAGLRSTATPAGRTYLAALRTALDAAPARAHSRAAAGQWTKRLEQQQQRGAAGRAAAGDPSSADLADLVVAALVDDPVVAGALHLADLVVAALVDRARRT